MREKGVGYFTYREGKDYYLQTWVGEGIGWGTDWRSVDGVVSIWKVLVIRVLICEIDSLEVKGSQQGLKE